MDLFSESSDDEHYEAGVFDSDRNVAASGLEGNRRVQTRINFIDVLSESEFVYRFRLNKTAVRELTSQITPALRVTSSRNYGISPLHQLLLTLRFYALGTMLVSIADFAGVSISSASRIVKDVSRAIAQLYPQYIKMYSNTQSAFHAISGFPRVLGAIDCTHIPIQSPNSNIGEEFRNRKGIFSFNVQGICNADLLFMNIVARWPGSAHDATIFNNSIIKVQCEDGIFGNRWLIGDSAYPCTSYLLTPVLSPSSSREHQYNHAHALTRNPIERCFGLWKRRFPVLSTKIRLALETTQAVIIACSVLHNICMTHGIIEVNSEVDLPSEVSDVSSGGHTNESISQHGHFERQNLINNYVFNL